MNDPVRQFVLRSIARKARLPVDVDIETFDYIDSGHVDSVGIIKFMVNIEAQFDIEITEAEMESPEFRTVGGLISLISRKIAAKGQSG